MTTIETQTTHTVTLEWPCKTLLSKDELIHKLSISIPNRADIIEMSIADVPRVKRNRDYPEMLRTLTITYRDDPITARCRRP